MQKLQFSKIIRNPQAGEVNVTLTVFSDKEGYSIGKDFVTCTLKEGTVLTPAVINSLSECMFYAYRVNSIPASIDKAKEIAGSFPSLVSFVQIYLRGSGQSVCPFTESELVKAFPQASLPLHQIDIRPEKLAPVQGKGKLNKIDALVESAKSASRLIKKGEKEKEGEKK